MLSETHFPFLAEKDHVVSLVGGGGKTTLLYAFARHCAAKGWRVLVSTTTHIRQPGAHYAADEAALAALWAAGQYAVAGVPAEQGKLTALPSEQLTRWMAQADIVLLEADGAKRLPCKAPAAHEPVLLPESDIVLAVAGLSALGRPLREVCFRLEQACALLGAAPETLLTPELLARLLASEQGGRKQVGNRCFSVVLNQADDPARIAAGEQTLALLRKKAVAGVPAEQGKLTALPSEQLTRWMAQADIVLLEADGAKRLPCKAPAAHEPVLLPESDIVLAVAGLSALGRPLREVCFRLEQACALLGAAPETLLTPELLARLLASEQGGRKQVGNRCFSVVLNQADDPARIAAGEQTLALLRKKYEVQGVLTYFDEKERA